MAQNDVFEKCIMPLRPPGPAPETVPQFCPGLYNAEPNAIRQYINTYIYVWTEDDGVSFWMYPTAFNNNILYGYIWNGKNWVYSQLDRNLIISIF